MQRGLGGKAECQPRPYQGGARRGAWSHMDINSSHNHAALSLEENSTQHYRATCCLTRQLLCAILCGKAQYYSKSKVRSLATVEQMEGASGHGQQGGE